jgi:hypothetical protein
MNKKLYYKFEKGEEINRKLQEIIFQGAGYISMCWEPKPSGVFDSTTAEKKGNEMMAAIIELFKEWHNQLSTPSAPLNDAVEEQLEDKRILDEAKIDAMIRDWFNVWCAGTKRSGGILITTSIKELLTDFYNQIFRPNAGSGDNGWIDVKDGNAKDFDGQILVTNGNGFVEIVWYDKEDDDLKKAHRFDDNDLAAYRNGNFTHWQPLPSPPKSQP